MMPTVAQQLTGIRNAMTKVVIPGLDPADRFLQEQAALIVATLQWILDVQACEYTYEATENAEYRALAPALAATAVGSDHEARAAGLVAAASDDRGELPPLDSLRAHTRDLKALVDEFYSALAGSADAGSVAARQLVLDAARRQARRDQSWFRMTGFPKEVEGDIAAVLAGDRAGS